MGGMKHVLLLGAFALASASFATFDLVYVADEGTDTIHRFDGGSGVYLGAFTGPFSNPRGIAIDQTNSRMFVTADNGIFIIDLWSGTLMNAEAQSGQGATVYAPGQYLFAVNGSSNYLGGGLDGSSGWFTGASLPGAIALRKGVDYQNNVLFTASAAAGVQRYSLGSFFGAATLLSTQALTTPGTLGQTAVGTGYALTADGSTNKLHFTFASGGGTDFVSPYSTLSTLVGVDFAHNDVFYAAGRNATNTSGLLIQSSTRFTGTALRTYGSGILQNPTAVATITAPEPASMIGLGLGALLLRRRRRA